MMGERRVMQEALFYGFSLERHVPDNHLLRKIDRFVDLSEVRRASGALLQRDGSSSDRSRADDSDAHRWLWLGHSFGASAVRGGPPQSDRTRSTMSNWNSTATFPIIRPSPRTRDGRFRESDLLRKLFETVVARCMKERIVEGATPSRSTRV